MLDPALAVFVATPLRRIVAVNRAAVQPYTSKGRELFRRAPPPLQAREDSMETKIYGDTAFKRNQGLRRDTIGCGRASQVDGHLDTDE